MTHLKVHYQMYGLRHVMFLYSSWYDLKIDALLQLTLVPYSKLPRTNCIS